MKIWPRSSRSPTRVEPEPGQESVWDYPRPPKLETCPETRIRVNLEGVCIADSTNCCRVLETSHPPVYYIPLSDLKNVQLFESDRKTWCEWKGQASYVSIQVNETRIEDAGWFYASPSTAFSELKRKVAFYPSKMEACYVNGEQATAQPGDFYGGWITSNIVGPFKGGEGTRGW